MFQPFVQEMKPITLINIAWSMNWNCSRARFSARAVAHIVRPKKSTLQRYGWERGAFVGGPRPTQNRFPRRRKSRAALNLSRYQNMSNLCQRPAVTFRSHMSAMTQCRASYYELCLESGRDLSSIFTSALTISSLRNYIWVGEAVYRQTLLRREKEEEPANRLFMPSALIPTAYVSLPPSLPTYTIATFDPNNDLLFSRDPDRPHTDIRP